MLTFIETMATFDYIDPDYSHPQSPSGSHKSKATRKT